ncbi:unnamed protein product, partial [Heterotrigona itama]
NFMFHREESRWSKLRLEYVSVADAGTSILSILDITTQGNNSIDCANTRSIRIHRHQNTLYFAPSHPPQPTPPQPLLSFARSVCYMFLLVCSWKIGSRTFPRCSRKSPEYPETDANALMRHLQPRDVTQICRVSPGHYCIYTAADISRPGQEQQEQVEARVSDGG